MKLAQAVFGRLVMVASVGLLLVGGAPQRQDLRLTVCTQTVKDAANEAVGRYQPSDLASFVTLDGDRFRVGADAYPVRGVNYYPSRYPWRRFLTEADLATVETELRLLRDAGFNTLRLFVWNEALFQCPGSGAVPRPDNVHRLDSIMRAAAAHGFRLIVTLNDLPNLAAYSLYNDPAHTRAPTDFLVRRYRDEAAILAWDVRNEGDIDYGTHRSIAPVAIKAQVLGWLAATTERIRALDSRHLITAGWLYDAEATAPYVDFNSFHHWTDAEELAERVAVMRAATDKPLLLEEIGYSTQRVGEVGQAAALESAVTTSESLGLLGWLVWAAFDFPVDRSCYPSPCLSPDNGEHYFGMWRLDYTPRPALEALTVLSPPAAADD